MQSNVNLIGQGEEVTILDAEETDRVILLVNCVNNIIRDLTIRSGSVGSNEKGGGIYCDNSTGTLTNLTVKNSFANEGGGISIWQSNMILDS